jgi:uncharacterized protein
MMASYVVSVQSMGSAAQMREFLLPRIVIGREAGDLVIADARCSATHAELLFDGSSVRLRDLGSSNGTFANGQRLSDYAWPVGSTVQIGNVSITLVEIRGAQAAKGRTMLGNVAQVAPQQPQPYGNPGYGAQQQQQQAYGAPRQQQAYGAPQQPYGAQGMHAVAPAKRSGSATPWVLGCCALLLITCGVGGGGLWLATRDGSNGNDDTAQPSGATLTEARETTVEFVWFSGAPGPTAKGGTSPARIRVAPNKTGTVSVGVAEEFAGGGGNQWRTATWLAAFNSSRAVGGTLTDYEFTVHVGGHTDGPSAGMLTTATMLSLLRGTKPRADTTMTGTINPDGSAGPVGGIVQKIEGAKAKGLKRFGFPIGCRNHRDMKTGSDVDLISFGAANGMEVKEISDLYEGYEFLTGDKIARSVPVAEGEMEPASQTNELLKVKTASWKARIDREIGLLKEEAKRSGSAVQYAKGLIDEADKAFAKAQRLEKNGFFGAALESYVQTALSVSAATRFTKSLALVNGGQVDTLLESMTAAANIRDEVDAFGAQLEIKAKTKTRGGQVSSTAAFTNYASARAAVMIGDDFREDALGLLGAIKEGKVKLNNQTAKVLMLKTVTPIIYYDASRIYLDYVKDAQDLIGEEGTAAPLAAAVVERTMLGYASASAAVLEYFDAIILEDIMKETGKSKEEAQSLLANKESDYYQAIKENRIAIAKTEGSKSASDGFKLMKLGAASESFILGGKLVNKYYSLGGRFDKNGDFTLENRRALSGQLELARSNAREAAARSKKAAGFIPSPARLAYQLGNAEREGNDEEKLHALTSYWMAAFWSELAAQK